MAFAKKIAFWSRLSAGLISMLFPCMLHAGFEDLGTNARAGGLGEAFVGLANTSDALFINPAGLARLNGFEMTTYFSQLFGLKELNYSTLTVAQPLGRYTPAFGIHYFGYAAYRELSVNLALARHFQHKIYYGLTARYLSLTIKNYGSAATLSLDWGVILQTSPTFALGLVLKNWNRPQLENERLPQIISSGLAVIPFPDLILTLDLYKDIHFPLDTRVGIEYLLFQTLALRAGIASEPARLCLGCGIQVLNWRLDYAYRMHPILGGTHQVSISFAAAKNLNSGLTTLPVNLSAGADP
ncbi:hypothetical protein L0128_04990 [candidate division KSB1 bacterium]|nr:hypothetical protein [candidate division KSB1 bacterium]